MILVVILISDQTVTMHCSFDDLADQSNYCIKVKAFNDFFQCSNSSCPRSHKFKGKQRVCLTEISMFHTKDAMKHILLTV